MNSYYFDSSALIKRYLEEAGSSWVREQFAHPPTSSVFISELTLVEVAAALARHEREKSITSD